jgi:hypothetical protein
MLYYNQGNQLEKTQNGNTYVLENILCITKHSKILMIVLVIWIIITIPITWVHTHECMWHRTGVLRNHLTNNAISMLGYVVHDHHSTSVGKHYNHKE